jgi:glucose/mannose-6-phosphate isomerase
VTVDDVLAYTHQIGDALWRIESAGIARGSASGGVAVCGPSGGAGALAAFAGAHAHDGLAEWAGTETFVLCASYSGDDGDAMRCFEEAGRRAAPRAVVCTAGALAAQAREEGVPVIGVPAGLPDRGAVVYFVLAALSCAGVSLDADPLTETLDRLGKGWGPEASALAERLRGSVPVFAGPAPIARRWASSFEAATGSAAFWREDAPPAAQGFEVVTVEPLGETPLERLLAGVFQGDLVAAYAGGGSAAPA